MTLSHTATRYAAIIREWLLTHSPTAVLVNISPYVTSHRVACIAGVAMGLSAEEVVVSLDPEVAAEEAEAAAAEIEDAAIDAADEAMTLLDETQAVEEEASPCCVIL